MNKFNFVRNSQGVIKLPPGFRFQPTEEELVFQYLRRKIFSCPLPSSTDIIPEINLAKYDPWDLPFSGDMEEDRYFFSSKEVKNRNGSSSRANQKMGSGYWKATGSDKKILSSMEKNIVGTRKTLVFYRGKPPQGNRSRWFMHEYTLHMINNNVESTGNTTPQHASQDQAENSWVICRIFLKEKSTKVVNNYYKNRDENIEQNWECDINNTNVGDFGMNNNYYQRRMFDLAMGSNNNNARGPSSPCSSSSSSSFNEVSSSNYVSRDEENNNGYTDF